MRKMLVLAASLLLLGCGDEGDDVTVIIVSGTVRRDGLEFVGGVTVRVMDAGGVPTGNATTTDSAGAFAVSAPANSRVYLQCALAGCAPTNGARIDTAESAIGDVDLWVFTYAARTAAATGAASAAGVTADLNGRGLVVGALYEGTGFPATGIRVTIDTADPQTGIAYIGALDGSYGDLPFTAFFVTSNQYAAVNVPAGDFTLTEDWDASSASARSVAGEVTVVNITGLREDRAVLGAVVTEDGAVVGGATVAARDAAGTSLATTTSDADGVFCIKGLGEGTEFYLRATKDATFVDTNTRYYVLGADPVLSAIAPLVTRPYFDATIVEMEADLSFTYDSGKGVFVGDLKNTSDTQVSGETVAVTPAGGTIGYVDDAGSFDDVSSVPYPDAQIVTRGPQWVAANVDTGDATVGQSMDAVTYEAPSVAGQLTFMSLEGLPVRAKISGRVRDDAGQNVVGAVVTVYGTSITAMTVAGGLFSLTGRILSGSRVALRVTRAGHKTTNTAYVDVTGAAVSVGDVFLLTDAYFTTLVADLEAANAGLTVDMAANGMLTGSVRDLQIPLTVGSGKVDGATVSLSPSGGLIDYVDEAGTWGNAETDSGAPGQLLYVAANVSPGDVVATEDWDGTSLEAPVRLGELTQVAFARLTPQNSLGGAVYEDHEILATAVVGAAVTLYDEDAGVVGTATTDSSGVWQIDRIRAGVRAYVSVTSVGYTTTNTPYYDIEYSDIPLQLLSLFSATHCAQLEAAWATGFGSAPDTAATGTVGGSLITGLSKVPGHTATIEGESTQVGYIDDLGQFAVEVSTHATPQIGGEATAQFWIYDLAAGDYVLTQTGDGKTHRLPVRAGEYTHAPVAGISTTPIAISGVVSDGSTPVAGATVRILGTPLSTLSAADGSYSITGVPARSRVAMSVSKGGVTMNQPYYVEDTFDTTSNPVLYSKAAMDLLAVRYEQGTGPIDLQNNATVFGVLTSEATGEPVAGVTVGLVPAGGVAGYFDEYLRSGYASTRATSFQFMIGNVDPGDAGLTQDRDWQTAQIPCRAGEYTFVSVSLRK